MKEIKFRGWDKQDKRMIVHEQDFIPLKVTNLGVLRLNPCIKDNNWEFVEVDRFELMQYIGMKDINDVEIYEGDILKAKTNIGYVKYNEKECSFEVCTLDWDIKFIEYSCWEVIGNIHENSELLEV